MTKAGLYATVASSMAQARMRPEFEVVFEGRTELLLSTLKNKLTEQQCPCAGQVFRKEAVLWICEQKRHFWSPYLYLRFAAEEDTKKICGRFAPHPHVWTMFMAMYGVLLLLVLAGIVYGASQHILGQLPWAYLLTPFALALIAFVYGAAFIGQGLGAEQMYQLRSFLDDALKRCKASS
ncbi:MAG: hypothetical protein IPJ88_01770 [Myxococcales bacterium]|nr:MAG: hypothetical protein IPJ88_01770 [Myxococcales bacterium]